MVRDLRLVLPLSRDLDLLTCGDLDLATLGDLDLAALVGVDPDLRPRRRSDPGGDGVGDGEYFLLLLGGLCLE